MRTTSVIILFLSLFYQLSYSQSKIVDSKTGEAIAFAHLIIDGGKLGATSNINGIISIAEIEKMAEASSTTITIQHLGYDNLEISLQDLKQSEAIRLNARNIVLSEVTVNPSSKYDYVVLKGFFRSYQINDNELKYYTDGIVEYYFPKKRKKFSVNLLEHRTFRNQKLIDQVKRRSSMIVMKAAGIPYMDGNTIIDDLDDKYTFVETQNGQDIIKSDLRVGYIRKNNTEKNVQINIDKILPEKENVHSAFGYTSRIQHIEVTENYISDNIQNLKIYDLESRKESREILFGHKKEAVEVAIEAVHEFYVIERRYVTKKEMKGLKLSSSSRLRESSEYTYNYWEDLTRYGITPLSSEQENELWKSLTVY
jgi:hypothetical protein